MKKSQLLSAVCAGVVTLLASVTANAAIVYNLDRTIGAGTVTGFIETDGTIGVLTTANITNWELMLTAPNIRGGSSPALIDFATAAGTLLVGSALSASPTALTFDFSSTESSYLFLDGSGFTGRNWYGLETATANLSGCGTQCESIGRDLDTNSVTEFASRTGSIDIAVTTVPVPAAVWLFGSGLVGLVGVARRKARA